jgi:hypothetical protein
LPFLAAAVVTVVVVATDAAAVRAGGSEVVTKLFTSASLLQHGLGVDASSVGGVFDMGKVTANLQASLTPTRVCEPCACVMCNIVGFERE